MGDDVKILAVSAASATVAVVAALVLARSIVGSVERVRDASATLAARRPRRCARPSRARPRSPTWPPRSTRWRRASSGSSTRAASSSRGRATTCARRSRTCRRCSRRSRTASSSPSDYLPVLREQVARPLVARRRPLRARAHRRGRAHPRAPRRRRSSRSSSRACAASRPTRDGEASALAASVAGRRHRALRAGEDRARALQPPHERAAAHAVRRLGRRPRRAASTGRCRSASRTRATASDDEAATRMFDRFWRGDPVALGTRRGARARDRARARRGARRSHLGRGPPGRRRPRVVHAPGRALSRPFTAEALARDSQSCDGELGRRRVARGCGRRRRERPRAARTRRRGDSGSHCRPSRNAARVERRAEPSWVLSYSTSRFGSNRCSRIRSSTSRPSSFVTMRASSPGAPQREPGSILTMPGQ